MYLTDLHTHSILSMDGKVPLSEMAAAAVAAGVSALTVTDHYDMLNEDGQRVLTYDWTDGLAQFAETVPQFEDKLNLYLGIELGSAHVSPEHARAVIAGAGAGLDQIIGSIHNFREEHGGGEYFFADFHKLEDCHAALDDYLTSMEELVALPDCYDVLGHIIYPLRYMHRDGHDIDLMDNYRDRLAEILRAVIKTDRSIEVNTCRGKTVEDWRNILLLYRDLGGTLVTTGSDAHLPEDVGKGLRDACALLSACGFDHLTVYNRRQAELIKL